VVSQPAVALRGLTERDIPRSPPSLVRILGRRPSEVALIKAFIRSAYPQYEIQDSDSLEVRQEKDGVVQSMKMSLNAFATVATINLKKNIEEKLPSSVGCAWGKIPKYLVNEAVVDMEKISKRGHIDLDRCIGSWGALLLLASHYRNSTRNSKDKESNVRKYAFC
jgi:hypothetical protein